MKDISTIPKYSPCTGKPFDYYHNRNSQNVSKPVHSAAIFNIQQAAIVYESNRHPSIAHIYLKAECLKSLKVSGKVFYKNFKSPIKSDNNGIINLASVAYHAENSIFQTAILSVSKMSSFSTSFNANHYSWGKAPCERVSIY